MRIETESRKQRVAALLQRYGWNATSFQVLEPEFHYWFADSSDEACVAYVDMGRAWVVAGPPIASEASIGAVASQFVEHARKHRRRVCFFAVERRFLRAIGMRSMQIGEQPLFDPQQWNERQRGHRSLREQLRRARAKGVAVECVPSAAAADPASPLRGEIERVIERWLCSRPMPPMAFLVELHPFGFAEERRYYIARLHGGIAGVLVAVPVYLRDGWFFENVIRDPDAPNGTAELLVDFAARDLASTGTAFVTLGLAPLAGDVRWLSIARKLLGSFYSFEGLRAFKAKFRPTAWDPIYLAYPARRTAGGVLYDVLAAFGRHNVARFAAASMFRAPAAVLRGLALLLVPWTIMLALADSRRWFPSRGVQVAWVAFDTVICGVLFSLAKRWRQPLGIAAAVAVSADAALTSAEALAFNARRGRGFRDVLVITASIVAPLFAAGVLIGGVRRHRGAPARRAEKEISPRSHVG